VVTGLVGTSRETLTFLPVTYTQYNSITAAITTTIQDARSSPITITVGPLGVAWTLFTQPTGSSNMLAPSLLASVAIAPPQSYVGSSVPLPSRETVITSKSASQVITETFVPTIVSGFSTLGSTITITTSAVQGLTTKIIGPGGVAWAPLYMQHSGNPGLAPPSVPPVKLNPPQIQSTTPSISRPGIPTTQSNAAASSGAPSVKPGTSSVTAPRVTTAAPEQASIQSSVTDAFAIASQSETTFVADGTTQYYSKSNFPDLATITAPITVTTPVVQTNSDNSQFTISAAVIIVGPGGTWYVSLC